MLHSPAMTPTPTRHRGRPATGIRPGERITDYHRTTVRLPPDAVARLRAAAIVTGRPAWKVILDGLDALISGLPDADRALVAKLARRQLERGQDVSGEG